MVDSSPNDSPCLQHSRILDNSSFDASIATFSGANGDNPYAIRSALIKLTVLASCGKNSCAEVVFPAPLGPAIMIICFIHVNIWETFQLVDISFLCLETTFHAVLISMVAHFPSIEYEVSLSMPDAPVLVRKAKVPGSSGS